MQKTLLNSFEYQKIDSKMQSKILGGYTVESSGVGRIEVTNKDGSHYWTDAPERVTMEGNLIVCREYFYDEAWH